MSKFTPINGFTKKKMIEMIEKGNKGMISNREGSTICAYRGEEGNKCAVGIFIPDELYKPEMEGIGSALLARSLVEAFPELVPHMPIELEGLNQFQNAHDSAEKDGDPRPKVIEWVNNNVEGE